MSIAGTWHITMKTPRGVFKPVIILAEANNQLTGTFNMPGNPPCPITEGMLVGNTATMKAKISHPVALAMQFSFTFQGDLAAGTCASNAFQPFQVTGTRLPVDGRGHLARWKDFLFG